jgi:hypothetical protein
MRRTGYSGRTVLVLAALILGAAGMAGAEAAGRRGMHGMRNRPGRADPGVRVLALVVNNARVAEELGLGEEKIQALRRQCLELQIAVLEAETELKKARLRKAYLLQERTPDEKALMTAIEEVGRQTIELEKAKARIRLAVEKALSPEQRDQLRAMLERHMQKRRQARHRRMGRGREARGPRRPRGRVGPRPPDRD